MVAVFYVAAIASSSAQLAGAIIAYAPTNQPPVSLWLPHMDHPPHAPATVSIFPRIEPVPEHPGKTVELGFFANARLLGSSEAAWHDEIRPDPHSSRPQPMVIVPAGYNSPVFVWTNAPAGTFVLTSVGTWPDGWSATSEPVTVTIAP